MPIPAALQIVQFAGDSGYYPLYRGSSGEELNDTCHDSIEAALDQAAWEFGVQPAEWEHAAS